MALTYAGRVAARWALDSGGTAEIAWTQVHAIMKCITCAKGRFKWRRSEGSPIAMWRHEESPSSSMFRPHDRDLTATRWLIFFSFRRRSGASYSNLTAEKTCGRTPRSRPDRTAIAARSSRHQCSFNVESFPLDWTACDAWLGPRSWPDRGAIAAWSWHDRGAFWSQNWDYSTSNSGAKTPQPTLTTRSIIHDFKPNFLFKKPCTLSLFLTFDRLVKKLNEFRGRSLVHRDPPSFRLDCEAIGVRLIANFSLISSNFPLEFWTSARKNPSKFTSIHEIWSPILAAMGLLVRFDRLLGGDLSFY